MKRSAIAILFISLVGACSGPGVQSGPDTIPTTSTTTTTLATPAPSPPAPNLTEISDYLVALANLDAEESTRQGDFETEFPRQWCLDKVGFEDCLDQLDPEDQLLVDYAVAFFGGLFDVSLGIVDQLDAMTPPSEFRELHGAFANSYRALATDHRERILGVRSLSELEAVTITLFDELAAKPPEVVRLQDAFRKACTDLEEAAADMGIDADLSCPPPPPEVESVEVEVGGTWQAVPNPLPASDAVAVTVTNTGDEPVRLVVVEIFGGDPLKLPLKDGLVDLSRSGENMFDGSAWFRLLIPSEEQTVFGELEEVPVLAPGESTTVTQWITGPIVVFDHRPDVFDRGAFMIIERGS